MESNDSPQSPLADIELTENSSTSQKFSKELSLLKEISTNIEAENQTEEDELEEDDVYGSLMSFTSDLLGSLGLPPEPLTEDERQPRSLPSQGTDLDQCLRLLQDLISYDIDEPEVSYVPECIDNDSRLAIVSHLLAALVTSLEPQHLRRLATRLVSDTSLWVSRIFRSFESTAFLHEDAREGVVRVCRMLLQSRYPKYASDGYEALYARPPVIYTSTAVRPGLPQHIASMLGLGTSCIRVVPCNTHVGSPVAMDTAALDRMMTEDINAQRKPMLIISNAGGGLVGGVDNVPRIQELSLKHEAWLHVEGHSLAALTLPNSHNLPAKVGDSMTLPLSTWLGIPALPYVTLYRACDSSTVHAAGLTSLSLQVRLASLPLWLTLQHLGHGGIVSRLQHAFELSRHLQRHLTQMDHIRMLSPCSSEGNLSIKDLVSKPISTAQLLQTACGTIVFQYVDDKSKQTKNSEYYDSLNSWLGQVIRRDVGLIPLELVHLESTGLVLRWSTLEGPHTHQISSDHIDLFVHSLKQQVSILNATVNQRAIFTKLVNEAPNLQLAEIPMWAGLGGVRYLMDIHSKEETFQPMAKEEINTLNEHLVNQLRNTDSAFSLGESSDQMNCVRFGMVTTDTDISELLSLVISTGKEIESSSKFITQMTEVVKKGIETATLDLRRETDERLWQEGLLRHVPLVGSVYNWLSPPPAKGIKGRTLDLNQGILESTENIYRYHMQVKHGQDSNKDSKIPPASVVTPVTPTTSSPSHSRSSSMSTTQANAEVPHTHSRQGSKDLDNIQNSKVNSIPEENSIEVPIVSGMDALNLSKNDIVVKENSVAVAS